MRVTKHSVTITTLVTATGTTTSTKAYTTTYVRGTILAVQYIRDTGNLISSTADLSITTMDSSHNILTSLTVGSTNFLKAPRMTIVNTTNGAIANEAGLIPVADERIAVTIDNSSSTGRIGTFNIYEC